MAKKRSNKSLSILTTKLKSQTQEIEKLKSQKNKGFGLTEEEEFLFADPVNRKKIEDAKAEKAVLDVLGTTYQQQRTFDILSTNLLQNDIIEEYQNKGDERQVSELQKRVSSLEKETKESLALAMSMIAVNKELINRVQEKQKTATAKKDTGPVTKEDTSTSILNKMYTFFVQGSERDKRNYEIQKDFAEERALESKRRKTTAKRRPTASKVSLDKPSSNPILDLIGFISKGIGGILGFISGGLFGIISKGLGGIKDFFLNIPGIRLLGSVLGFFSKIGGDAINFLWLLGKWGAKLSWKTFKAVWWMAEGLYKGSLKIGEKLGEFLWSKFLKKRFEKATEEAAVKGTEKAGVKAVEKAVEKGAVKLTDEELTKAGLKLNAAEKVVDAKTGRFVSKEVIEKASSSASKKAIKNIVEKQVTKKIGSTALKKIPLGLGAAAALWFSAERAMAGDTTGAGAELASGAAGIVPGVGTAASLAIDLGIIARDVYNEAYGTESNKFPFDSDLTTNPELATQRKNEIMSTLKETVNKYTKDETATKTNESSTPEFSEGQRLATPTEASELMGFDKLNSSSSVPSPPTAAPVSTATPVSDAPVSTATPTVTPPTAAPAPTEQREDDSASVTPDTTRPAMVTPSVPSPTQLPTLSDMSEDVDVGSTQVVNMPSQSNASYTNNEYTGSPSVRNPNPVVYRTAMRNDQAQLQ